MKYVRNSIKGKAILLASASFFMADGRELRAAAEYRFDSTQKKCLNSAGVEGWNKDTKGECSDFRGQKIYSQDFSGLNLRGSNFTDSKIRKTSLRNTNLTHAIFRYSDASDTDASSANFSFSTVEHSSFYDSNFESAVFEKVTIKNSGFSGANLKNTNFTESLLINIQLIGVNATNALFSRASIKCESFDQAMACPQLSLSCFEGARFDFVQWTDFAVMVESDIRGADFSNTPERTDYFLKSKKVFLANVRYDDQTRGLPSALDGRWVKMPKPDRICSWRRERE